jgi:dihydroorotate dehydrogenase (fumarate)
MDLSTYYLGLRLPHPLVAGASPLVDDLSMVQRLADAGAAAIVMHSLFEEQLRGEALARERFHDTYANAHAEAPSYLPQPDEFRLGPHEYLEQIRRIRRRVPVPVIASLNGTTEGAWLRYAPLMEEAGAAALELNLYELVTSAEVSSYEIERTAIDVVRAVCSSVKIPVAVKLSPYYTALPAFARGLVDAGARGLVLFNRFYQADIDPDALEVVRTLRLRWLAILSAQLRTSFAASGGVHEARDAVRAIMAGADSVQVVSALLRHGPERMSTLVSELREWLEQHEYDSLEQAKGSMNHKRCPDPRGFERVQYVQVLQSFRFE